MFPMYDVLVSVKQNKYFYIYISYQETRNISTVRPVVVVVMDVVVVEAKIQCRLTNIFFVVVLTYLYSSLSSQKQFEMAKILDH